MKKQEQHSEEQAARNPADCLQKRRKALIEYFRSYLRLTFEELRAASAREAEGLCGPLLAMQLDEEEIRGWERFRDEFAPRAIHAAEALVAAYESLLDHAECDRLLEHGSVERWRQFFRSPVVDFKDKREALAELRATLSVERGLAEERRRILGVLERREVTEEARRMAQALLDASHFLPLSPAEKRARIATAKALLEKGSKDSSLRASEEREMPEASKGQKEEKQPPAEEKSARRNPPERENLATDVREDDAALAAALHALPLSLLPLYRAAASRGAEAVRALTQVMARRVHHEEQPIEQPGRGGGGRFVILWRDESMEAPERALERVQCMAQLGSAQPVVVPQGVSRGSQAEIVRHVHPVLQSRTAGGRAGSSCS